MIRACASRFVVRHDDADRAGDNAGRDRPDADHVAADGDGLRRVGLNGDLPPPPVLNLDPQIFLREIARRDLGQREQIHARRSLTRTCVFGYPRPSGGYSHLPLLCVRVLADACVFAGLEHCV